MKPGQPTGVQPFEVKDCALIQIATGVRAQNLRELRDRLVTIHPGCIDYHFWGGLLRPVFDDPEYGNDFAAWARHGLHDHKLAERLAVIDAAEFSDIELLRQTLIETIEERIDEGEYLTWAKPDQQFQFIRSQMVVFDAGRRLSRPADLVSAVPAMAVGSIYYHFVDARRRPPRRVDDFRTWLAACGGDFVELDAALAGIEPYSASLSELRAELARVMARHLGGRT